MVRCRSAGASRVHVAEPVAEHAQLLWQTPAAGIVEKKGLANERMLGQYAPEPAGSQILSDELLEYVAKAVALAHGSHDGVSKRRVGGRTTALRSVSSEIAAGWAHPVPRPQAHLTLSPALFML
jgi:hypothetical protein